MKKSILFSIFILILTVLNGQSYRIDDLTKNKILLSQNINGTLGSAIEDEKYINGVINVFEKVELELFENEGVVVFSTTKGTMVRRIKLDTKTKSYVSLVPSSTVIVNFSIAKNMTYLLITLELPDYFVTFLKSI